MSMVRKLSQDLPVGEGSAAFELPAARKCQNPSCRNQVYVRTDHLKAGKIRCPKCGSIFKLVFKVSLTPEDELPDPDLTEPVKPWFWAHHGAPRDAPRPPGPVLDGTAG